MRSADTRSFQALQKLSCCFKGRFWPEDGLDERLLATDAFLAERVYMWLLLFCKATLCPSKRAFCHREPVEEGRLDTLNVPLTPSAELGAIHTSYTPVGMTRRLRLS